MKPTATPSRRRIGAFAVFAALAMAATALTPSAALADPQGPFPRPPIVSRPCSELGPIEFITGPSGNYLKAGIRYLVISVNPVFEPSTGRFIQNTSDQTITGTFTASESRTVTMTTTLNFSVTSMLTQRTTITMSTGFQVVQSRTSMIGVTAVSAIAPRTTLLGEYGIHSLDVVFDAQTVAMRRDGITCEYVDSNRTRGTAHVPTINEGWRFTVQ
ncbi:hypothetical protein [Paractinoplanes rishiriensis]|uniref:Uncharacterized protein n=1 Tax=Paractinoplanes rishiriensis TaxID=1050105 RepID=A0A919K846_9ACTN|nr:hypothetical protein [Actinoplanes rishiriensis]GIF01445.1 hypothetical protein Ari01nite_89090 [Actinoplanes rishiriensis]